MELRPYQIEAIDSAMEKFETHQSALIVMATGLGKTVTFSALAKEYLPYGKIMVVAHREELIYQAKNKLQDITGQHVDIEMGDLHVQEFGPWSSMITASSVQTQCAGRKRRRMEKFNPDDYSLLIVDECHHSCARSYKRVIDYYQQNPHLKVLGVTATPDRTDKLALGRIFDCVAYNYGIVEGIKDGYLVPIKQQAVYVNGLDYSKVRATVGKLNGKDLAEVLENEEALHKIASPTVEIAGDRKTLIFAASVKQAERLTEIINRYNPDSARFIYGKTEREQRRAIFSDYANNRFQFLVNVGVATEGFDDPGIEVVVLARPTMSRALYTQMAGRGTRILPGVIDGIESAELRREAIKQSPKSHVLLVDFVGNAGRHKLVSSADILGGDYDTDIVERANELAKEKSKQTGKPVDMMDELEFAKSLIEQEKKQAEIDKRKAEAEAKKLAEQKLREEITAKAQFELEAVDPFDKFNLKPIQEHESHREEATKKQIEFLKRNKIQYEGLSKLNARRVIDRVCATLTDKQLKLLSKYKVKDRETMTRQQATNIIGRIVKNNWRVPHDIELD